MLRLRESQEKIIATIKKYLRKSSRIRRILLNASCSTGKTLIALLVSKLFVDKRKRVLYISYSKTELREQVFNSNEFHGIISESDICVVRVGEPVLKKRFIIGIPQTLRKSDIGTFDFIIIDECHEYLGGARRDLENIIERVSNKDTVILGMTGTGFDISAKDKFFDIKREDVARIIYDMPSAIQDGLASNLEISIEYFKFELKNELYLGDDLNKLGRLFMKNKVVSALKLQKILKTLPENKKYLIIAPPGTAGSICDYINGFVNVGCAVCKISTDERICPDPDSADRKFRRDNRVRFMVVVHMASTGWDFPELEGVIDLTFTKSPKSIIQRLSRAIRPHANKKKPVYIYCCDQSKSELMAKAYIGQALTLTTEQGLRAYTGSGNDTIIVMGTPASTAFKYSAQMGIPIEDFSNFKSGKEAADNESSIPFGTAVDYYGLLNQNFSKRTIVRVSLRMISDLRLTPCLVIIGKAIFDSENAKETVCYRKIADFFADWRKRLGSPVSSIEDSIKMLIDFSEKFPNILKDPSLI